MYVEKTDNMRDLFPEPPVLIGSTLYLRPLGASDTSKASDAEALQILMEQYEVYRYLPTFLFEKKYKKAEDVILRVYQEGLRDSLILGIFEEGSFCGLAEVYGYRAPIRKASVGYRLLKEKWGKGIATEALGIMIQELLENRGIEIITASTMIENLASAHVLQKNGFIMVNHCVDEDWGFPEPTPADKWIR